MWKTIGKLCRIQKNKKYSKNLKLFKFSNPPCYRKDKSPDSTRGIFLCTLNRIQGGLPMENTENRREHYNLYYIFETDKQEHPMPPEKVEEIRKNIFEKNSKKLKLLNNENPP